MADDRTARPQKPHNVILEDRARLSISGVEDVSAFDDSEVVIRSGQGNLIVRGAELHVEKLSLDNGELKLTGRVDELSYEQTAPSTGLWSRMFGG